MTLPTNSISSQVSKEVQLQQVNFYLLLSLSFGFTQLCLPSTIRISTIPTGVSAIFLFTCSNHPNLFSCNFSDKGTIPNLSLNSQFLILSIVVWPHIYLDILISATSIFCSKDFCTCQNYALYNSASLMITQQNLPFSLVKNFLSHSILVVVLHLSHPA